MQTYELETYQNRPAGLPYDNYRRSLHIQYTLLLLCREGIMQDYVVGSNCSSCELVFMWPGDVVRRDNVVL